MLQRQADIENVSWRGQVSTCRQALPRGASFIEATDNKEMRVSTRLCSKALPLFWKCNFAIEVSGQKIESYGVLEIGSVNESSLSGDRHEKSRLNASPRLAQTPLVRHPTLTINLLLFLLGEHITSSWLVARALWTYEPESQCFYVFSGQKSPKICFFGGGSSK